MRHTTLLPALAWCVACSSATQPGTDSLTGTWNATYLPQAVRQLQLVLVQTGDTITGTGVYTPIGDGPTLDLQVAGKVAVTDFPCGFVDTPLFIPCHQTFQLFAVDAMGDTIGFSGGFTDKNTIAGDVGSRTLRPFENIDGQNLFFTR